MAPTRPSSKSSAFLATPLEIRQQIYQFCIPQNLSFICSSTMFRQNRPEGWVEPLRRLDRTLDWWDTTVAYSPAEGDHYLRYDSEDVEVSSAYGWDSDGENEYEPSRLDDYSLISRRHRPRITASRRSALPGLLLVCRQMTDEVKTMLYGGNTFTVNVHDDSQMNIVGMFSSETREKMRKMILVLRTIGDSYCHGFYMDRKIWDGILSSLWVLGVIIKRPELPSHLTLSPVKPKDVSGEWAACLKPILEYLARAIPRTTQVLVDANKEEDTVQILEKLMLGRCRFQRLRIADPIFRRGEFSPEYDEDWDDEGPTSCRDIIDDCDYDLYYSD